MSVAAECRERGTPPAGTSFATAQPRATALAAVRCAEVAPPAAAQLAGLAVQALLDEARLTPKPALVDQRGSGAHRDLDLGILTRSAHALRPTFAALAAAGAGALPSQHLREQLAFLGRRGEAAMLAATGGSNAHRGAIWVLGLLVAAAAMKPAGDGSDGSDTAAAVCARAAAVAAYTDRYAPPADSNGQRAMRRFGVGGAREQARAGFPHILHSGLPALHAARAAGHSEDHARLDALLAIMSTLADTCLLHRGGLPALHAAQAGAAAVLAAGGSATPAGRAALHALDTRLLALHASPGGAADLLAATLLIDRLACTPHQEA